MSRSNDVAGIFTQRPVGEQFRRPLRRVVRDQLGPAESDQRDGQQPTDVAMEPKVPVSVIHVLPIRAQREMLPHKLADISHMD